MGFFFLTVSSVLFGALAAYLLLMRQVHDAQTKRLLLLEHVTAYSWLHLEGMIMDAPLSNDEKTAHILTKVSDAVTFLTTHPLSEAEKGLLRVQIGALQAARSSQSAAQTFSLMRPAK